MVISMTKQNLKKLNRAELLKLLIDQMKENEELQLQNEKLVKKLGDRRIEIENAGSIAEAALKINGVFEAAEAAAAQYLENINRVQSFATQSAGVAASRAEKILAEAQQEAQKVRIDAQQEAQRILIEARHDAERIRAEAVKTWNSFASNE